MEQEQEQKQPKNKKGLIIGIVAVIVVVAIVVAAVLLMNKANIAGTYDLISMEQNGESVGDIDKLKELGFTATLELKEDKTGVLNVFGQSQDITYDDKNITSDGQAVPYKFADNKITLEQDGQKMVFQKK